MQQLDAFHVYLVVFFGLLGISLLAGVAGTVFIVRALRHRRRGVSRRQAALAIRGRGARLPLEQFFLEAGDRDARIAVRLTRVQLAFGAAAILVLLASAVLAF
jgi:hypothetical protein